MPGYKDPPKDGQFKPGQSGNPAGYSRRRRIADAVTRVIDEGGYEEALAKVAIRKALQGNMNFWREVADRVDGRTTIPLKNEHSGAVTVRVVYDDSDPVQCDPDSPPAAAPGADTDPAEPGPV